jgi:hypothetical protein
MNDLLFLGLTLLFLVLSVGFMNTLEGLREEQS